MSWSLCLLFKSVKGTIFARLDISFSIDIRCSRCQWVILIWLLVSCFALFLFLGPMTEHVASVIYLSCLNYMLIWDAIESKELYVVCRGQGLVSFQRINLKRRVQVSFLGWMWMSFCIVCHCYINNNKRTNFKFLHFNSPLDATRDNDWTCPKCGNINFSFRTVCNMRKCNTPKPGSQVSLLSHSFLSKFKMVQVVSVGNTEKCL